MENSQSFIWIGKFCMFTDRPKDTEGSAYEEIVKESKLSLNLNIFV